MTARSSKKEELFVPKMLILLDFQKNPFVLLQCMEISKTFASPLLHNIFVVPISAFLKSKFL